MTDLDEKIQRLWQDVEGGRCCKQASQIMDELKRERDHYAKQPCNCKKIDPLVEAAKRAVKEAGRYSPDGLPRSPVMVDLLEAVAAVETPKDAP